MEIHVRFLIIFFCMVFFDSSLAMADTYQGRPSPSEPADTKKQDPMPGLDDFLQCTNFTWMQNCNRLNQWISDHPDQPVRMKKDGVEFYFPPGTPSATIDWVVNQTPESLQRYFAYLEKISARNEKSAAMYAKALDDMGGNLPGENGLDYFLAPPSSDVKIPINEKNVAIYVFIDSGCTACAIFEPRIAEFRRLYPNIPFSVLQVDNHPDATRQIAAVTGSRVTILPPDQLARYNIRMFPTIWIEDRRSNHTSVVQGAVTVPELARQISKVSK